jgi:hypothetical protein
MIVVDSSALVAIFEKEPEAAVSVPDAPLPYPAALRRSSIRQRRAFQDDP